MNARQAAVNILEKCFAGESLSGQLEELSGSGRLKSEECALAANLSIGTVQNYRLLDYYISACSKIPDKKIHPRVRQILRIGIYQLLFLDRIPAFAAINETADLCRGSLAHTRGFVNALLRSVASGRASIPELRAETPQKLLALKYSHPDWIAEMLAEEYGTETAEKILAEDNRKPELSLFVNTLKCSPEDYAALLNEKKIPYTPSPLYREGFLLPSVLPSLLPGYREGLFYIQDPSAHFLSTAFQGKENLRILDCCSAPGGKSISTALACQGKCSILSCDVNEGKTAVIGENRKRLGLDCISTAVRDATVFVPEFEEGFDAVIADVPCSGLGVIRKHPEIRLKSRESISELPELQKKILENSCRYVRPGGLLVYSTCSLNPAENSRQIEAFLASHINFSPLEYEFGGISLDNGCITFLPGISGGDGFFTAMLQRKKK